MDSTDHPAQLVRFEAVRQDLIGQYQNLVWKPKKTPCSFHACVSRVANTLGAQTSILTACRVHIG